MTLFREGWFTGSSGLDLFGKIDCDALTDEDLHCCALWILNKLGDTWSGVEGVPTGGKRLSNIILGIMKFDMQAPFLIVDDVMTTGKSMELFKDEIRNNLKEPRHIKGAVIFQRGASKYWVTPLFVFNRGFF